MPTCGLALKRGRICCRFLPRSWGLAGLEGRSLFEAAIAPRIQGDADAEGRRGRLTPETASEVLRQVARGVFPSVTWEDIYHHQSLEEFESVDYC